MRQLHGAVLLVALTPFAAAQPAPCSGADLIVHNARIVTMDDRNTVARAMALQRERILYVGAAAQARRCAAHGARFVDLGGRTVLPGLIDVHTHAHDWARSLAKGDVDAGR